MKAKPITVEQYFRYQLSKDRCMDTLEDIFKHIKHPLWQVNVTVHTDVNPDTQAWRIPVINKTQSYVETINKTDNNAEMGSDNISAGNQNIPDITNRRRKCRNKQYRK